MRATLSATEAVAARLTEGGYTVLDLIADLIVQYGSEVPGFPLPVSAESRRVAQFLVGGVNQLIESWRVDPDCSVDELAATASRLCMTVSGLTVHEAH